MPQYHFDPSTYDALIAEIPGYEELQRGVADATSGVEARRVLDLGAGTGATAAAVLAGHPDATVTLLDESAAMLAVAGALLPGARVADRVVADLRDPLPAGPYDLAVSGLAIHHLPLDDKRGLFERVHAVLVPGGRFVMGDVVVPDDAADAVLDLEPGVDLPSRPDELLAGLVDAGFTATVTWQRRDLAVFRADAPTVGAG